MHSVIGVFNADKTLYLNNILTLYTEKRLTMTGDLRAPGSAVGCRQYMMHSIFWVIHC
jgi:hypothetical protein